MLVRLLLLAATLTSTGRASTRIGEVFKLEGDWCRQAIHLAIGNPIFLDDDVRYCSDSLVKTHYIVIRVDGATPYDRPYLCSTPGICDTKEKLWLAGAYYYQRLRSPGGGILQSFPKTISNWISPDFVVQQGDSLAGIPKNRKPATTGVFGKTGQAKTYEYCTFNNGQIDNCSGDFDYISDHCCPRRDRTVAWSAENTRLGGTSVDYLGGGLRFEVLWPVQVIPKPG